MMGLWATIILGLAVLGGCRSRAASESAIVEASSRENALFQCAGVEQSEGGRSDLKIFAEKPDHPRQKPHIFITVGGGARVRAHCGERHDLGAAGVFACWYSGGGLTVTWPELEPPKEAVVKVKTKHLFGAIAAKAHQLRCTREDSLEAVRQAAL